MTVFALVVLAFIGPAKPIMGTGLYPSSAACQDALQDTMHGLATNPEFSAAHLTAKCVKVEEPLPL